MLKRFPAPLAAGSDSRGKSISHPATAFHGRTPICMLLLFASGSCALIYQVCWFRQFRYFFGTSTMASAAVMAIFMGGLGWGSLVLGARADKRTRPLRYYAKLELGIGLFALLSPLLFALAKWIYIGLGGTAELGLAGASVVRLALSLMVIGVPTFLMGGTLPAAVNAVTDPKDTNRRGVGWLYGANTLGAFAGGILATFYLHERVGVRTTILLAGLLNLTVAGSALALSRGSRFPRLSPGLQKKPTRAGPALEQKSEARVDSRSFVLVSASLVGFVFLLQEMVWYRVLAPILGGSTYTISLILCAALLGIGLGGGIYPLWRRRRPPSLPAFAFTCSLEAVLVGLPLALGDRIAVWASVLHANGGSFTRLLAGWMLILGVVVILPSAVAGVQFPLLIGLMGRGRKNLGGEIGLVYVFNSAGAIAGAIAGGFGLMILLSATGTWRLAVALLALLALAGLIFSPDRAKNPLFSLLAAVLSLTALLFCWSRGPTAAWRHSGIGAGRSNLRGTENPNQVEEWLRIHRRQVVWEKDGIESNIGISDADGFKFIVNGRTDGNALTDAHTQVMGGLIGAIIHPRPERALVIGLGTGSTAGWLGVVPGMVRVDVVELEPAVAQVAARSAPVNERVLENPRVRLIYGDARELLLTTRASYDIIFSEPSNPYRAGIASLYTREFYQTALGKLNQDGLFLQWLQGYSVDEITIQRVYSTLAAVFPRVETWITGKADLILLASRDPKALNMAAIRERVNSGIFRRALRAAWRVEGLEGFLSRYLANHRFTAANAIFEGSSLNSDDRTYIEFAMARTVGRGRFNPYDIFRRLTPDQRLPEIIGPPPDWTLLEEYRANLLPEGFPIHRLLWPGGSGNSEAFSRVEALIQWYGFDRSSADYPERLRQAVEQWRGQSSPPQKPDELLMLAEWAALTGDGMGLSLGRSPTIPDPTEADVISAMYHARIGRPADATRDLIKAFERYQVNPWAQIGLMDSSLRLAYWLAGRNQTQGEQLYQALKQPFSVQALKAKRTLTAFQMSRLPGLEHHCVDALEAIEPHVYWDEGFLAARADCYSDHDHELALLAAKELARFRSQTQK